MLEKDSKGAIYSPFTLKPLFQIGVTESGVDIKADLQDGYIVYFHFPSTSATHNRKGRTLKTLLSYQDTKERLKRD